MTLSRVLDWLTQFKNSFKIGGMNLPVFLALLFSKIWIEIDGFPLAVELAQTIEERTKGLSGREFLEPNQGMLFIFDPEEIVFFWMKETKIPLSIGFFDKNLLLFQIEEMGVPKKGPLAIYRSQQKTKYALEMPAGWFQEHAIRVGAKISFPNPSQKVE